MTYLSDEQISKCSADEIVTAYRELRDRLIEEARVISEQTTAALADRKARGMKNGGDVPYGYSVNRYGQLLELPAEQAVIAEARRLKAEGESLRGIAFALRKQKMRPRPGRDGEKRSVFTPTQVSRLIRDRLGTDTPIPEPSRKR